MALKLVTNLCDGGSVVNVAPDYPQVVIPEVRIDGQPFEKLQDMTFLPPGTIEQGISDAQSLGDVDGAHRLQALQATIGVRAATSGATPQQYQQVLGVPPQQQPGEAITPADLERMKGTAGGMGTGSAPGRTLGRDDAGATAPAATSPCAP